MVCLESNPWNRTKDREVNQEEGRDSTKGIIKLATVSSNWMFHPLGLGTVRVL